jgi:hypothetical protein
MRKVTVIILIVIIAAFVAGFFYLNNRQESETGYRDGLKMGYLYGFNDGRDRTPPAAEDLGRTLAVVGGSAYDNAFLVGAKEGYVKGYGVGKEVE